jgi:hypothetical protein
MKAILYLCAVAVLFLAPSPCFALWEIAPVTKERATELGMESGRSRRVPTTFGWSLNAMPRGR